MDLLEKFVEQGFTLRRFPAYERHLGVVKHNCVALLEPTPAGGWRRYSSAGYLLDGAIALLVQRGGRQFFVHKTKQLAAEGQPLENLQRFLDELESLLSQHAPRQKDA